MANNELKILIQGELKEKETEAIIKSQLEQIQKNLKVSIGIDDTQISKIAQQVKKLQEQLKNSNTTIVSDKDSVKIKNLEKDFDRVLNKYKQLGEVSFTKSFNPLNDQFERFNLTVKKTDGTIEKLKFELAELAGIKGLDNLFYMKDKSIVDNTSTVNSLREKQLKQEEAINTKLDERRQKHAKEIADLEHEVKLYQERSRIETSKLAHRYGNSVDDASLKKHRDGINSIPTDNVDVARKRMAELSVAFKDISTNARIASRDTISFGDALGQALVKYPIWIAATTLFVGSFRGLQNVTQVIIDVDRGLTDLKKVMDQDTNFTKVMDSAIASSEKFAKSLTSVLDAYGEFARQGYKEDDLVNLGEAGLITSNVGEIEAGKAADYMTASLIQWKKESSDAMSLIDSWNNISNKYATTVEKLAAGQAKAASTAKAMGMDFDQLNAVIGMKSAV